MSARDGLFAGEDPFVIARSWLAEAEQSEPNDPNAIALATVDRDGMPDVRMVLLKDIESYGDGQGAFVFYTNYESAKGVQIAETGNAAFVMHWKSLRRQIRVRGTVTREDGAQADEYYRSRALQSRIGAWASQQSRPLSSRRALMMAVAREGARLGADPPRPAFWGGFRINPQQIEFWADGAFRLHDRFRWTKAAGGEMPRQGLQQLWQVQRLAP
ncbi:pyridoxamine 5'-phosphate oxidase [Paracoccus aerodenitrificans]|uniref:pyridoxamine 5'-phosphate oxidase n=1 Tax=Paracoccus aerodenitrificans TaxID=3017781 RepID=UPI0022F07888|nr:pyridoxamine 5'-phosphate oxidase [Paracoccus aerodenitrificans]WBU63036.1 pyridoxamine 5'-phosphate oxidase [Paracoccus aerodenitrificans]